MATTARRLTVMLDFAAEHARLLDAEHHVAVAEWRIICQLERIDQLRLEAASIHAAAAVLKALECGRDAWDVRRSEILIGMGHLAMQSAAA